jgi:hypothetical protein
MARMGAGAKSSRVSAMRCAVDLSIAFVDFFGALGGDLKLAMEGNRLLP